MKREEEIPWTRERIISVIQMFHLRKIPLNFKHIKQYNNELRQHAEKFFGSWGEAVEAAGIDYEEIKKNKGWATPFLGEDGVLYSSKIEGAIANKLYEMVKDNKILNYDSQTEISPGRSWTSDFSVTLLNGAKLFFEIDNSESKKKQDEYQEKLNFYESANVLYYKVFSTNNIENIVNRFTSWFSIPLKDTIITTHKDPDGDALSSASAVYNYLESNGKKAVLKFSGDIPKNLEWIIESKEVVKKVPDWVENIIVLDCAPTHERVGWELPNIPVYNIDHHKSRIEDNDPDNDIHVIDSCSTASILFNYFGIKDDILSVGLYTDTLFTKNLTEVLYFLLQLNVDEEKLSLYISKINSNPDRKLWKMVNESDVHRCRNGFVIIETKEDSPDIIESFMQILSKMSESVCLLYGKNADVKLRTSNPLLDLSEIAKEYSGGGHSFASMCNVNGKISEFKSKIKSLSVPKFSKVDGYES